MGAVLSVVDIPIELIDLMPSQITDARHDGMSDVSDLAQSIRSVGLLEPPGVRRVGDRYRVVYGRRRIAAVSSLGWQSVPAVVVDSGADMDPIKSLVENVQRRQLSRQERAHALERLLASGLTGKQIAERSGIPENHVYAWLRVARSEPLMNALSDGLLGINEARLLASGTVPAPTIAALLPELQGQPEQFRLARIQRALDDNRSAPPPRGFYKANVEKRTMRLLVQIAELMKGVREVRTAEELRLVQDIVHVAQRWQRDLARASLPSLPP